LRRIKVGNKESKLLVSEEIAKRRASANLPSGTIEASRRCKSSTMKFGVPLSVPGSSDFTVKRSAATLHGTAR
jgi:hypothetical protein